MEEWNELSRKILLDRYAQKEIDKSKMKLGDTVVIQTDPKTGQREVGVVKALAGDYHESGCMVAEGEAVVYVDYQHQHYVRSLDHIDLPSETTPAQIFDRVARGAYAARPATDRSGYNAGNFQEAMTKGHFIPAGRILAGCGTDQNLTYYNCFVLPSPTDSRHGIFYTLDKMAEIMSRGGGVGINLSTLRPRYCPVYGVNGRSSGAVSWGELYSQVTGKIEQGGSRRGALMLILNVWHPDIEEFIHAKRDMDFAVNCNISVGINEYFMEAVQNNEDWPLVFPEYKDVENYDEKWKGNLYHWIDQCGGKVKTYKTVKARALWDQIMESAWVSAEPGLFFIDRANQLSPSKSYKEGELICTNPCGEQPLPAWAVCNLGHVNLAKMCRDHIIPGYVETDLGKICPRINWPLLGYTTKLAVDFLDRVIDVTPSFIPEIDEQQRLERRIGLGTIGLAELLIRLGVPYGSPTSLQVIDCIYSFMRKEAQKQSQDLAQEFGPYPAWSEGEPFQRNVTLLTQAPTGTVGTMMRTSTGIEPFYSWKFNRTSRLGTHKEYVRVMEEYLSQHGPSEDSMTYPGVEQNVLPSTFVNAMTITPREHVEVMARIQKYMCSAVSKTCNLPESASVADVREIYELMYKLGCKGGTVYRDKSRDVQVLNLPEEPEQPKIPTTQAKATTGIRPRPAKRRGTTMSKSSPSGTVHIVMNDDADGKPLEVFIETGKSGSDLKGLVEALGRIASVFLRVDSSVSPLDRVRELVDQCKGIGGMRTEGFGANRILSIPDAMAKALEENYLDEEDDMTTPLADLCPRCGQSTYILTEGCQTCAECGHSEC